MICNDCKKELSGISCDSCGDELTKENCNRSCCHFDLGAKIIEHYCLECYEWTEGVGSSE